MTKLLLKIIVEGTDSLINMTFGYLNGKMLYWTISPQTQQSIKVDLRLNCEEWLIILLDENKRNYFYELY